MKIFEINPVGICTNPNEIIFEEKDRLAKVKTAFIDGGWYFGTSLETKTGGHTFGVRKDKNRFETEKHCIEAGINDLADRGFICRITEKEQLTFEDMLCN
jgi:hypothetical protein